METLKNIIRNSNMSTRPEYYSGRGAIEAHIVGSGEMYWGSTSMPNDQANLEVWQVAVINDIE